MIITAQRPRNIHKGRTSTSYSITLPKAWIDSQQLNGGRVIFDTDDKGNLLVIPYRPEASA